MQVDVRINKESASIRGVLEYSIDVPTCPAELRHMQEPPDGAVHRVPGQPGLGDERGVRPSVGDVQCELVYHHTSYNLRVVPPDHPLAIAARLSLPLHQPLAKEQERLPARQPRVGAAEGGQAIDSAATVFDDEERR